MNRFLIVLATISTVLLVFIVVLARDTLVWQLNLAANRIAYALGKSPPLPDLVEIPGGVFMMGSKQGYDNVQPVHEVEIAAPFYLSATEITFEQFDGFAYSMGRDVPDDRGWGRGDRPVIYVNWDDAKAYAQWLGEQTDNTCRLPTEAEWEYAARAGTTSRFALPAPDGGDDLAGLANCADCGGEWAHNSTVPVASFPANAWGLHDMHGNLNEWVEDCWHDSYTGAPADGSAWLDEGGGRCDTRVLRSGSWLSNLSFEGPGRGPGPINRGHYTFGFRVSCSSPID